VMRAPSPRVVTAVTSPTANPAAVPRETTT
jgi:hypothetical protein